MKLTAVCFALWLGALSAFAGELMVPHITGPNDDFHTTLYVANVSDSAMDLVLTPYAETGVAAEPITVAVPGNRTLRLDADDLFQGMSVSHAGYDDLGALRVSMGYRARSGPSLTAHVTPPDHPTTAFSLPQGDADRAFDSLALVNTGSRAAAVTLTHLDALGEVIQQVVLSELLAPMARTRVLLNNLFPSYPGSSYLVTSDQPMAAVTLGGSLNGAAHAALFQGFAPQRTGADVWLPHITAQSGDFQTRLLFDNPGDAEVTVALQPYAAGGSVLPAQSLVLAPGAVTEADPGLLPEGTSHVVLGDLGPATVRLGYARRDGQGLTSYVAPAKPARDWVFLQGDRETTWDGFALTNPHDVSVTCTVQYEDFSGGTLGTTTLTLGPHEKQLWVPAQAYSLADAGSFRLAASGDLVVLALRGNAASSVLFANLPTAIGRLRLNDRNVHDYSAGGVVQDLANDVLTLDLTGRPVPAVGDLLIGDAQTPFLREVLNVTPMRGATYEVVSETAPATALLQDGTLIAAPDPASLNTKLALSDWEADFTHSASLSVQASGRLDLELTPRLEQRVAHGETVDYWLGLDGNLGIDLSGSLVGTLSGGAVFTREGLIERTLAVSWHYVGFPVFVAWELEVDAVAEFSGTAQGQVRWATSAEFAARAGASFTFDPAFAVTPDYTLAAPRLTPLSQVVEISADVTATFHLIPRVHARIMSLAGPFVGLDGYTRGTIDVAQGTYAFGLGLRGAVGGELNPAWFGEGHTLETELFDRYWPLSSGTYLPTGEVSGQVFVAGTGAPLVGVHVAIFQGDDVLPVQTFETDAAGSYTAVLPEGSNYRVTFAKTGYLGTTYFDVGVVADQTTYLETVLQVDASDAGLGGAAGRIVNALDGQGVDNLLMRLRSGLHNQTGAVVAETSTSGGGYFSIGGLDAGHYTAQLSAPGYQDGFFSLVVLGGQTLDNQNSTVTPLLAEGETRIILTWGAEPTDLDSYLTGPSGNGRFVVYFADRSYQGGTTHAELDHDDVSSYGPETITLTGQGSGTYRYFVHNFSDRYENTARLSLSGAQVRVIRGNTQIAQFNVPTNRSGTVWHVFDLVGPDLVPVNLIGNEDDIAKTTATGRLSLPASK